MNFLGVLLGTIYTIAQAENELGREQLEYSGTHGVVTTGFESAPVDNISRGIFAVSNPSGVRTVSNAKSWSWAGPSLFVCLPN